MITLFTWLTLIQSSIQMETVAEKSREGWDSEGQI